MEQYKIENLSFRYPSRGENALKNINLSVNCGEFVTLCGKSGCGKTTLLRLLKTALSPVGEKTGEIYFCGKPLDTADARQQAEKIGFVMQNPDNQIVTDKVWHELAFGLESLGFSTPEIRVRVSEMASFFGIESLFYKNVVELSGGQKQLLNLASVMALQPGVLILDEPTSQLDPIAADEFLATLEKINRELGTTVILSEHRLEDAFRISDRVIVLDDGAVIADAPPKKVGEILKTLNHEMQAALPTPMRIYNALESGSDCSLTVGEGRIWLEKYSQTHSLRPELIPRDTAETAARDVVVEVRDAWFKYERNLPDVIKNLNVKIEKGTLFAILGGNGTGKTTALSLMSGLNAPYRGEVFVNGKKISEIKKLHGKILSVLPQNPQTLFVKKKVYLDLDEILSEKGLSDDEKRGRIAEISSLCRIENLLESHPYDLSGGEQQRAALAKVLLNKPQIILMDEPTKGLDAHFKKIFADIIDDLTSHGVTVVMVSHDMEFCAEHADKCALFFDGSITSTDTPRKFFAGKNFYTTSANRIARSLLPDAILCDDVVRACGGVVRPEKRTPKVDFALPEPPAKSPEKQKKPSTRRSGAGIFFALLFVMTAALLHFVPDTAAMWCKIALYLELAACFAALFPQKELGVKTACKTVSKNKLNRRTIFAALLVLIAVPLTIYLGTRFFGARKYYFISLLIILETLLPFGMMFEKRKPQARELVIISVLCALGVAGRAAFYMLPQFKPVTAIVIISGVCFGGETGFLVGAVTGFVSNFFFGQGPWTPWQMFAFGIIGFIGGVLFEKGLISKTRLSLCVFGFAATLVIYGGIMNPASVIMYQEKITREMLVAAYASGLPFDLIHALSSAFFLWFISEPMIDKFERVKLKYGLIDR